MRIAKLPKRKTLSNLLLAVIVLGLPLLIFATYKITQLITNANADTHPRNVILSNLTPSSITISWTTDSQVVGYIIPVKGGKRMSQILDSRDSKKRYTHYVELTELDPDTKYDFIIKSGSDEYTQENGKNFTFTTAPISSEQVTPNAVYGRVSADIANDTIIYVLTKDKLSYPSSDKVPKNGGWSVDISGLRKLSDNSITKIENSTDLVVVAVSGTRKSGVVEGKPSTILDAQSGLKKWMRAKPREPKKCGR